VNRKCPPRNTTVQRSIPYTDPESSNYHPQNFQTVQWAISATLEAEVHIVSAVAEVDSGVSDVYAMDRETAGVAAVLLLHSVTCSSVAVVVFPVTIDNAESWLT